MLKAAGCCADDWANVFATDTFDPKKVCACRFYGKVVLGNCQLVDSTIADCTLADGCKVIGVRLLKGYTVETRSLLRNIGELSADSQPYMPRLSPMNENGCRAIGVFRDMTVGDAFLWAKYRGEKAVMGKLQQLAENEAALKPIGHVGKDCAITNCLCIRNVAVADGSTIESCTSIEDGVVGNNCHIANGVIAQRFLLGENVRLLNGLRLSDSVVGDNSTLACCEVVASMLFPAHEQHHNNSFLIAATLLGQCNIAAGATIGSNHNSRHPDGELLAGRGFWPALCSSFKHPSRFASYCLLAKADYPFELNIPLPFALVNNNVAKNRLEIMPAYWWLHNMYALKRNALKFKKRDHRTYKRQHIEFDLLAPDTVEEIIDARRLIKAWTQQAYNPATAGVSRPDERQIEIVAHGIENSKRKVLLLKPGKAYEAYGDMLVYYAMKTLTGNGSRLNPHYDCKSTDRVKKWHNIGGQLVADTDLEKLFADMQQFTSWNDIHMRFDNLWNTYAEQRQRHAWLVLLDLLLADDIDDTQWLNLLDRYDTICAEIERQADLSRAKDFNNPFRLMTFDSVEERDAVLND